MSLNDILQIERERIKRERLVLDTVYERLNNRINNSVRVGAKTCIYTIPELIPGYPLVNTVKTMIFLLKKLKKEGFIAFPLSETILFITWDPKEIRKLDELNKKHSESIDHSEIKKIAERENDDFISSLLKSKKEDNNNQ